MADDATSAVSSSRPTSPTEPEDGVGPLPSSSRPSRIAPGPYRFHWDPTASRRQGPPSASDATESRLDLTLDVSAAKIESIFDYSASGSVALPSTWSSSQHGFNAISTVLNNPHSKPNPLKSSRAPIFSGPHPDLPRLRRKDFDPYLKAITPEWQQFLDNQKLAKEAAEAGADPFSPGPSDAGSSSSRRKKQAAPPPIDTVPKIFFDEEFSLGNAKTFSAIADGQEGASGLKEPDLNVSQDVQDLLSQHLDVVEQHLTIEIQARSSSFFAALSNLHSLQAEGAECLTRIGNLRKQLVEVDEKQAKRGLEITRLTKKRDNLSAVQEGVRAIHSVGESVALVKNLVNTGEYFEALALIDEMDALFKTSDDANAAANHEKTLSHPHPPRRQSLPLFTMSMSSLVSLSTLPQSLKDFGTSISTSLSADLVALLRADLLRDRPTTSSAPETPVETALHDRILPLLQGLIQTGGVDNAIKSYQDGVLREIRACVRSHLPVSEWDEDDLNSQGAAMAKTESGRPSTEIKTLSYDEFLKVAQDLYDTLFARLQTVSSQINSINAALSTMLPPNSELSPTLNSLLSTATELAHLRASKFIALRSAANAELPLSSFLQVHEISWNFVVETEKLSRRMVVHLRGVVVRQSREWLTAFHADRISKAARAVEEEVWAQVEVSSASQKLVDLIVDGAMGDPKEFVLGTAGAANGTTQTNGAANGSPKATKSAPKLLTIEERTYFVVGATLEVLELLVDYIKVIVNMSLLTTEAMSRIIEFLKAFNSRTCQVVLGAGAMRSAGLKNITAKHLALASQSLSVMIALVPYIRETLRRHLNPKQAVILVEFDKLKRDYQEHQNEIHSKLIAIMGDRLGVHCKSLHDIQWDQPAPKAGPNPYMEVLVKETVTLHKVLSKYLAEQSVEIIMSQVFAAINHRLSEEYGKIELPNQEAKTRLLQDAKYLHEKLSNLQGINMPSSMLETVVMEKSVPRKGSPFPVRRPTLPSPNPLERRPSTMMNSSPLANGDGSPRMQRTVSGRDTPTMQALLAGGRSSPSPMQTPPAGRQSPSSPVSRSPFASPKRVGSPSLWPTSAPVQQVLFSPSLQDVPPSAPPTTYLAPIDDPLSPGSKPPPTPPKDCIPLPTNGAGLGLKMVSDEPESISDPLEATRTASPEEVESKGENGVNGTHEEAPVEEEG